LSTTFITPDKLDEAIDHALANPVDYNFAIDLQGNQYMGRDQPANIPKNSKQETSEV
jgi:small subunit ribosomal protein S26